MSKVYIFTEAFNCGRLLVPCLNSFYKYHDYEVNVVCTDEDIKECLLEDANFLNNKKINIINVTNNEDFKNRWKDGHHGTALSFASSIMKWSGEDKLIHFDSDVIFKEECIQHIINKLDEGYGIVGTPRAYKNNLSGVKGLDNLPDTISTYIMGINRTYIPTFDFEYFVKMCGGFASPLNKRILDFFDPVIFSMLDKQAKIFYLDTKDYGGMDNQGKKYNGYLSNLNFDCGKKLVHFGGVGSGYAYFMKKSSPPESYATWALGRWSLYAKLFFNQNINCNYSTIYSKLDDHEGKRWCSGNYDENILQTILKELNT